jgi:hypothetical protein
MKVDVQAEVGAVIQTRRAGKSAEKRLPTLTDAQAMFSALLLDLVVPNPVTPTKPLGLRTALRVANLDFSKRSGEFGAKVPR